MEDSSKYDGIYICNVCGEKTPMTDEQVEIILYRDRTKDICPCGATTLTNGVITAKFLVDTSSWRVCYGSTGIHNRKG